ncbi:MAG: HipA domain-containing protein [Pseudomonadota bacterium]
MQCLKCLLPIENIAHARYSLHFTCFEEWFHVDKHAEFVSLQPISHGISVSDSQFSSQNTSFFHGKFKKYSAELNGENYLFKMRQTEAPELPEVEYLCNQIARICHINTTQFYFIEFNGDKIFVTKNFIQSEIGDDLQHIYQFRLNDQHSCEDLIKIIGEKTRQPVFVKVFIKTVLFDALIGNHDRHGRNLAFIANRSGYYLSPIYDNVSYLGLESGEMLKADFNPVGKITTQAADQPCMTDYVHELIRLGYKNEVQEFYQHLKGIGGVQIMYRIDNAFCSDLMREAIKKLINKRFKELENVLSA